MCPCAGAASFDRTPTQVINEGLGLDGAPVIAASGSGILFGDVPRGVQCSWCCVHLSASATTPAIAGLCLLNCLIESLVPAGKTKCIGGVGKGGVFCVCQCGEAIELQLLGAC